MLMPYEAALGLCYLHQALANAIFDNIGLSLILIAGNKAKPISSVHSHSS